MILDEELFEKSDLSFDDKLKYIKEYPTYISDRTRYFTRPCKYYDLDLTPEQEDTFFKFVEEGELNNFWIENAELADNIYQAGRMGGHLILDDEQAMPNDWSDFDSFEDVVQAERDEYRHYSDEPLEDWEEKESIETAQNKVNLTYNKVVDFDHRVDQLIDLLKQSLDGYVDPSDLNESLKSDFDPEVQKEINFIFASDDASFAYQMLDRLRSDCAYVLGALREPDDNKKLPLDIINKFLWFHDIDKQIDLMKGIYERLEEKPEWISEDEIEGYRKMLKDTIRLDEDLDINNMKFSDEAEVEYRGFIISPFTITKVEIGEEEYPGWTRYNIRRGDSWIAERNESNELEIKSFNSVDEAKAYIDSKQTIDESKEKHYADELYYALSGIVVGKNIKGNPRHAEVYALIGRPGYHLELPKEVSQQVIDKLDKIAKDYNVEHKIVKHANYNDAIFYLGPAEELEEGFELPSADKIKELAKKHALDIRFLDDKNIAFWVEGGTQEARDAFMADYTKLCSNKLEEDLAVEITEEDKANGMLATISELLKDELDAIQAYNDAVVQATTLGYDDFVEVFKSLVSEETVHVGELQKLQDQINPKTISDIEDGQKEAEEHLEA